MGKAQHLPVNTELSIPYGRKFDKIYRKIYKQESLRNNRNKCSYCLEPLSLKDCTADHVVPRSLGGKTSKNNIVAACRHCNKSKGAMSVKEFKKALMSPKVAHAIDIHIASFRYKINKRSELACLRIRQSVDLKEWYEL